MPEFSVRADSVNVEEIMRQIRARVKEKRGADYTEDEITELAAVKLERFLDPLAVRSGLLDEYRNQRSVTTLADIEPAPDLYGFDEESIYASSRGASGRILRTLRKILNPILKLFFNPNPLIRVLNMQTALNGYYTRSIARVSSREALNFEVLNNIVVELTRLSIENRNLTAAEQIARGIDPSAGYMFVQTPVNVSRAEIYGIELAAHKRFDNGFNMRAGLAYARGTNLETDQLLASVPPLKGIIGVG